VSLWQQVVAKLVIIALLAVLGHLAKIFIVILANHALLVPGKL
jgi:hypothetical protein